MALDPKLLDSLPNTLVDMFGLVEIDILSDMARRISTYDYFIPAAQHQNQKLQELGATQENIIQRLSEMTGKTQQELVDLLSEASAEAVADDLEYYTAAEVYEPSKVNTDALHKQLNSGLLQTQQSFFNITQTTANTATKQFEKALDRAWTQISTGGMDYNTAVKNAITDLADAGIGSIEYKSGRVDNIEVAVRRAVVTGANQTSMKIQETLADELDVDLVETTAHGGARPDHAKWQGKVFSRKGRVTIDGVTYEDFRTATGYGTGAGLGGWNCRHNFHPYVPGTSRAYSDEQLKELDKKKISYNGEMYTEYEASQIQRGIERDIRKKKRTVAALDAAGLDSSAERKKLRESQKAYTDFTEQTGIKKQSARTQIPKGENLKTENPLPDASPKQKTSTAKPKQKQTERQKLEEQARSLQGNFAKKMGISEDEAARRFDLLVSSNSDAQLKTFIKKYSNTPDGQLKATTKFVPAKTIQEAEKHIETLAKKVSYEGVKNIDTVNAVNEKLTSLTEKYPIRNLEFISTNSELGRVAAQANHSSLAIGTRFLNKIPKADEWQKRIEKNPMHIERFREQMMKVPKAERGKYERIIREHEKEMLFTRWTVAESRGGVEQIQATITHEYGHIVADQYIGQVTRKEANPLFDWDNSNPLKAMQNKIVANLYKARQSGDIYKMSMYAEQDEYEFFAEAFTMYELGEPLPDYVEHMVKEVLSFGAVQ